jgi:hypothetical protein
LPAKTGHDSHTGFTTGIPLDRICDSARVRNLLDLAPA